MTQDGFEALVTIDRYDLPLLQPLLSHPSHGQEQESRRGYMKACCQAKWWVDSSSLVGTGYGLRKACQLALPGISTRRPNWARAARGIMATM